MTEPTPPPTPVTPPPAKPTKPAEAPIMQYPLGALGAMVGAAVGVFVMQLAYRSGFYFEAVIGLCAGFGASLFARRGGWIGGAIAGIVTAAVGVWAEWWICGPFVGTDPSLASFVMHLNLLSGVKILFHLVGIAAAVWIGARK